MYHSVLVGYDGSDTGRAALIEAAQWARRWSAEMTVLYVAYFDPEEFGIAPEQADKRAVKGDAVCREARKLLDEKFGVGARFMMAQGDPPDEIVRAAEDQKTDLIVLGTHGRKGLSRWVMGSVSSKVLTHLTNGTNVLVVKKPCVACTGVYKNLLVPYDGSEPSRRAIAAACGLAQEMEAKLHLLYVIPRYEEMVEFFRTDSIRSNLRKEAESIVTGAVDIASRLGVTLNAEIGEGAPVDEIRRVGRNIGADLVVMGSHGYRGVDRAILGSTTERMIIHSERPVLVVR